MIFDENRNSMHCSWECIGCTFNTMNFSCVMHMSHQYESWFIFVAFDENRCIGNAFKNAFPMGMHHKYGSYFKVDDEIDDFGFKNTAVGVRNGF